MNTTNTWISIPANPYGWLLTLTFVLGVLLAFFSLVMFLLGAFSDDKLTRGEKNAAIILSIVGAIFISPAVFVGGNPNYNDTKSILTTDYGLSEDTAKSLTDDLFTNKRGNILDTPQNNEATVTYTDPATNETVEYRILTSDNRTLMKLQTRTLDDTTNSTADETEWVDVAPLTGK